MSLTLNELLKDSAYKLTQFNADKIQTLESSIIVKETRGKVTPYINCLVRNKEIKLTPEEAIRQLYVMSLKDDLGYPASRMELEYGVTFGREKKRADICIFDKDRPTVPYILVELKKTQTQGWQRTAQKLLQCHRRADGHLEQWRIDFLLSPKRSQLF